MIAAWVLQFTMAYVQSHHTALGLEGIRWSNPISAIVAAIVSVVWFAGGDWKRTKLLEDLQLEQRVLEEVRLEDMST
jgi:Na+-driven multidrug efflux pump